jgi:hypothetical protein
MDEPSEKGTVTWQVRAFFEFVGWACILAAGFVIFEIGTGWGFLLFVPAVVAVVCLAVLDLPPSGNPTLGNHQSSSPSARP